MTPFTARRCGKDAQTGLLPFFLFAFFICMQAHAAQSFSLTPAWSIAPRTPYEWVSTNHTQRSIAYNPVTGHLLTVSRYPETNAAVYVLNSSGQAIGQLSTSGVYVEINFPLNTVGVAADGVIYACNLTVDSTNITAGNTGPFRIYQWSNEGATPTVAYLGDPSDADSIVNNRRFGDSFAVRGSGANTEIVCCSRAGNVVARFTTLNGSEFSHQLIRAPGLLGAVNVTISFGAGNTFWVKPETSAQTNYPLQHFSYDTDSGTATLLKEYTGLPGGPLRFDPDRNLFGMVLAKTHEFRLLKLTESGLVQQGPIIPFAGTNANGNWTGGVAFSPGGVFALESNNGIIGLTLTTNTLAPFSAVLNADTGGKMLSWPSAEGFLYQPQYRDSPGAGGWSELSAVTNGTGSPITILDSQGENARFYRVRAE